MSRQKQKQFAELIKKVDQVLADSGEDSETCSAVAGHLYMSILQISMIYNGEIDEQSFRERINSYTELYLKRNPFPKRT